MRSYDHIDLSYLMSKVTLVEGTAVDTSKRNEITKALMETKRWEKRRDMEKVMLRTAENH